MVVRAKDRKLAAPTAKPEGLYLVNVIYPENLQFHRKFRAIVLEDNLI